MMASKIILWVAVKKLHIRLEFILENSFSIGSCSTKHCIKDHFEVISCKETSNELKVELTFHQVDVTLDILDYFDSEC